MNGHPLFGTEMTKHFSIMKEGGYDSVLEQLRIDNFKESPEVRRNRRDSRLFDAESSRIMTTFYMPHHVHTGGTTAIDASNFFLPYDQLKIVEPFEIADDLDSRLDGRLVNGRAEVVFGYADDHERIKMCSKISYDLESGQRAVTYEPYAGATELQHEAMLSEGIGVLKRFLASLENRDVRYIEETVSRQVRRANKWSSDYREYVVIPKERSERYDNALRRTEMVKRLVALHAVRGHLRHYRSGKIAQVKPHTRGNLGNAVQVKDYKIES